MADLKNKKVNSGKAANPLEIGQDLLASTAQQAAVLPTDILREAATQVGLTPRSKLQGEIDLRTGDHQVNEIAISQMDIKKNGQKIEVAQKQFQMVRTQEKVVLDQKTRKVEQEIAQLMNQLSQEVQKLQQQTTSLSDDVKNITVETALNKGKHGIYHLNFFEWLIRSLRDLRRKVTASRMWLQATYQKKQKKGFWAMAKKHGATFTDSGERTPVYGAG